MFAIFESLTPFEWFILFSLAVTALFASCVAILAFRIYGECYRESRVRFTTAPDRRELSSFLSRRSFSGEERGPPDGDVS